jgi:hypothetical protein
MLRKQACFPPAKREHSNNRVTEPRGFSRCEPLLLEAGSWGKGHYGNSEEGERPLLEAATKQRSEDLTVDTSVCVIVTMKCSHELCV